MAKRIIQTVLLLFSFFSLEGLENSNQIVKRVHSHLIIKDLSSACLEAEEGLLLHPTCQPLWEAYIQSLTKSGREKDALKAWGRYVSLFPEESQNRRGSFPFFFTHYPFIRHTGCDFLSRCQRDHDSF
jgi:hypothetical protein